MVRFLDLYLCSLASFLKDRTIGRRKVPAYVLLLSLSAATGGLMFGYDIGISGGVTVMDDFLCQFFPDVLEKKIKSGHSVGIANCSRISDEAWQEDEKKIEETTQKITFCLFGDEKVQLFTSSLYLAAMVATFFAAYVSRQKGRKMTITMSSIFFVVGVILNICSGSIELEHHASFGILILGRIMLGIGVGFGNQAIPLFISEIAPADARGSLNYLFQLNITIGIFFANIVNWKAQRIHPWGWRLSLGLAGIPAVLLAMGSLFLVETPSSYVQRGLHEQAHEVLGSIRGKDVDTNLALQDIVEACHRHAPGADIITAGDPLNDSMNTATSTASTGKSFEKRFNGLFSRCNRPPLIITIFVQFFQQFSGINVVILYAPVIFTTFGSGTDISLLFVIIISSVNVASTLFSIAVVDRIGRRRLVLVASGVMFCTQLLIGMILIGANRKDHLEKWRAIMLLVTICVFVSAFACSWGPLAWLIATEIFPLSCRSEGQSVTVFFNMLFTFVIAHTSLSMFCTMMYGIFIYYALWAAIMGSLTFLFLPETMNMDIEIITFIWSYHKFWKQFVTPLDATPYIIPLSPFNYRPPSSVQLEMSNSKVSTLTQQDSLKYT